MKKAFKQEGFCWETVATVYTGTHTGMWKKEQVTTEKIRAANKISYPE